MLEKLLVRELGGLVPQRLELVLQRLGGVIMPSDHDNPEAGKLSRCTVLPVMRQRRLVRYYWAGNCMDRAVWAV